MNRRSLGAAATLLAIAWGLAACSAPAPQSRPSDSMSSDPIAAFRMQANKGDGPRVEEMAVREGRQLAARWCGDLSLDGKDRAMANLNQEASRLDAINIALFALEQVCPELESKVEK